MTDILLSIIIPVYNVEQYLPRCIESILSSGFNRYCELILVDDGSTDRSGEICDQYQGGNAIVIHEQNSGVSMARNTGLRCARGQYVTFIDSDDYVAERAVTNVLSALMRGITSDIIFLQADKVYPNGKMQSIGDNINSEAIRGKKKLDVLKFLARQSKFSGSVWAKLFKRSFLEHNDLLFPEGRNNGEDLLFALKCIYLAQSYEALDFPYYRYRQQRQGSTTNQTSERNYQLIFSFLEDSAQLLTRKHRGIDFAADMCMSFAAYEYCIQVWGLLRLLPDAQKRAIVQLKRYKWILSFAQSKKVKTIRLMVATMGFRLTSLTLMWAKKIVEYK
jgi:glycosyltransferase involved in cell wall biosynthesis